MCFALLDLVLSVPHATIRTTHVEHLQRQTNHKSPIHPAKPRAATIPTTCGSPHVASPTPTPWNCHICQSVEVFWAVNVSGPWFHATTHFVELFNPVQLAACISKSKENRRHASFGLFDVCILIFRSRVCTSRLAAVTYVGL